ncbi:MAG: hypothetical protein KAU94_00530 [Verrucomicrobia bacterium]|nr:hypothetical protein [Verrucomicrobiota bacterium]
MKYAEVAVNVKRLVESRACETGCRIRQQRSGNPPSNDEFIHELLLAYNTPKATVARLKNGQLNLAKELGEVLLKKKVWFKNVGQASSLSNPAEPNDGRQAGSLSYFDVIEEKKVG